MKWVMGTPREVTFPEAVTGGVPIRLKDAAVARQKRQSHLEEWRNGCEAGQPGALWRGKDCSLSEG